MTLLNGIREAKIYLEIGITSYGGYKDWFIEKFERPGYIIEAGSGVNPLPISQFTKIYRDNIEMLLLSAIL